MAKDNTSLATAFPQKPARIAAGSPTAPHMAPQGGGAISQVVGKGTAALRRFENSKVAMKQTGTALLHTGETLGSLFLSSMAEGYLGPDKLKLGGVDLRAPLGLVTQSWGLYQIMTGEKGGEHALAIGNGVTGSWLSSAGREAGLALRERRGGTAPAPLAGQPPAQGGASFRGESPMVYIPPLEQEYPLISGLLPEPAATYPHGTGWQGQPMYGGAAASQAMTSYPEQPQAWQEGMVPVSQMPMGGFRPAHPQPFPPQASSYAPSQAMNPVMYPGAPQPTPWAQAAYLEPSPRVAGAPREVMLTPEATELRGIFQLLM